MNSDTSHLSSTTYVDVGGYELAYFYTGIGSPTVVLDAGMGDSSGVWDVVQKTVAQFTSVCSYDRAGLGQSGSGPIPRTSQTIAHELHTLLTKANVPGPYVFVGHSFGGVNARVYASLYPDEVVGLVLVDSAHPDLDLVSLLPLEMARKNDGIQKLRDTLQSETQEMSNPEGVNPVISMAQVRNIPSLGALPLVILTHTPQCWIEMLVINFPGLPPEVAARLDQAWQKSQKNLLSLSSQSHQVVAQQSGHYIHLEEPELVVWAIRSIVTRGS